MRYRDRRHGFDGVHVRGGVPIGIYSALNKYTPSDFTFTVVGYVGLATPNFMLALVLMWIGFRYFGQSVGGCSRRSSRKSR